MEELIVKYIAKHSSVGMFDGIEKADDPYEWALSQFKNCPKMPKNKEGKVANALQALFASYKVIKKRLEEMKTENKLLNSQVSGYVMLLRNCETEEILLKEQIVKLRKEMSKSETERETFRCLYEGTARQLVHAQSNSEYCENNCKEVFSPRYNSSDDSVRFPVAPVRTRQTGNRNERVLDQRTENGQAVRQLSFMDFQSLVTAVGTFDPDNMDPVEFLSKLEKVVDVYNVSDEDACRILMICIPHSLTSVLSQEVRDKRADRGARREALRLAGTDLVNLRKITEVTMEIGEHPLAFASRLWEMFSCYSGLPNATKQSLMFKSALIAQSSSHMREAIALHVDVNTPYEQIISKMTPHFNARSQLKAAESRHPVAAFGERKCSRLSNGFRQRPWRFERLNSEGVTLLCMWKKWSHCQALSRQ